MISLENIGKSYKKATKPPGEHRENWGLRHICGTFERGQAVVLLGPSGSGKSTLLRCIGGIKSLTEGQIHWTEAPKMGIVFQSFNLFPHMTLLKNICYAPRKVQKWASNRARVNPLAPPPLQSPLSPSKTPGTLQSGLTFQD